MASMVGKVTTRSPRAPGRIIKMFCIDVLLFEQIVVGLELMVCVVNIYLQQILRCFASE